MPDELKPLKKDDKVNIKALVQGRLVWLDGTVSHVGPAEGTEEERSYRVKIDEHQYFRRSDLGLNTEKEDREREEAAIEAASKRFETAGNNVRAALNSGASVKSETIREYLEAFTEMKKLGF